MQIDSIIVGDRFRRDLGDLSGLAKSIEEIGLLHPIVVTPDGQLIAGARRLAACKSLGWTDIPVTVVDLDDIVRGEHAENVYRKDFTPTEAVAIGRALEEHEREKARERQGTRTDLCENCAQVDAGRTTDKVGAYVGMSGRTYEKARQVVEAAETEPETFGDLPETMDERSVDAAYQKLRARRQEAAVDAAAAPATPPAIAAFQVAEGDV